MRLLTHPFKIMSLPFHLESNLVQRPVNKLYSDHSWPKLSSYAMIPY